MRLDAGERERKSRPRRWLGGLGLFWVPNLKDEALTGRESSVLCGCKLRGTCGIIFALSRASAMRALCFKLREDAKCRKDALIPLDAVQGCSLVVLNLADILIRAEPLATGLASDVHGKLTVLQDLEGHLQMRHGNLEGH
ncbi:unnamed protein product [Prunus armeniaca]